MSDNASQYSGSGNDNAQDGLTQIPSIDNALQGATDKVDQVTNDVSQFADKGTQIIEDKLNEVTDKVDSAFNFLDNLFKKF